MARAGMYPRTAHALAEVHICDRHTVSDFLPWVLALALKQVSIQNSRTESPAVRDHVIIPATQEADIRSIRVPGLPRQKVSKTPISINKPGMMEYHCDPSYLGGRGRKMENLRPVQAKLEQDPI
jgi:hypothetical protein